MTELDAYDAGKRVLTELFHLISKINETEQLPLDYKKCLIISLPKKASTIKCEQYRTLSLVGQS